MVLFAPNVGVWNVGAAAPVGFAPKALPNPELVFAPKPPDDSTAHKTLKLPSF